MNAHNNGGWDAWLALPQSPRLLLAFLLPGLVIADLAYGVLSMTGHELWLTPGKLMRGSVLLSAVLILAFSRDLLFSWLGGLLAAFVALIAVSTVLSPLFPVSAAFDLAAALRVVYAPFTMVVFIALFRFYPISFRELMLYIESLFYLIGTALFLMSVLGIGELTYGSYAFGFIGVFKAQNDTGLTATIAMAAAFYAFVTGPRLIRVALMCIAMLGVTSIGTRTAISSALIVAIAVAAVFAFSELFRREGERHPVRLSLRLIVLVSLASIASLYAYGEATGKHILPMPKFGQEGPAPPTEYQIMKMERTIAGQAHRKFYLERAQMYTAQRPAIYDWLGEGAWSYRAGVTQYWPEIDVTSPQDMPYAEMDWFDFFGQFGAVFTGLLHGFYALFLAFSIYRYITTRNVMYGMCALMLGIYVSHSLIAGHAMNSPMVSTQISAILACLYRAARERAAPGPVTDHQGGGGAHAARL